MRTKRKMATLWVAAFLVVAASSQAQVTTGAISGTVADSTGAVLPGTTVVVLNEDTGVSRTVVADATGRYGAPSLNPGRYKVTARLEGFQTEVRSGILLTVGRQAIVDFQLQVGAVTQTVEVTGEAPLVEATSSEVHTLVNETTISELPLNGRDLSQLVLLQPGVTQVEQASVASHRGYGRQLNISGARGDNNLFLLDGTDINDFSNSAPVGPNGVLYGATSVREFEVKTSTSNAQYGRALGGIVNAVSKSGSNTLAGEVFEFLRNNALDARNFFDRGDVPPFRRNQFGGAVGGPIVRDKTFFHGAYEGLRQARSNTQRPAVPGPDLRRGILPNGQQVPITPTAAAIVPFWPSPTPGGRTFSDGTAEFIVETPTTVRSDFVQGRIDHQISDTDSLFGRITILDLAQDEVSATPGYSTVVDNGSLFTTVSETHVLSPRDLNSFRFAYNRNTLIDRKLTPDIPPLKFFPDSAWPGNLSVSGVMGFSIGLWPRFQAISNRFETIDDVMLQRGNHSVQFGANFQRLQVNHDFPNVPNGQYSFRSFDQFLQGRGASNFRGTPLSLGDFYRGMRFWYLGAYIQDDWRIRSNLTLNFGLRYDFQAVPKEVNGKISNLRPITPGGDYAATGVHVIGDPLYLNPTTKNFAPRFGFAWTPWLNRSTTVRGGFGVFFDRLDNRIYVGNRDGSISPTFSVANPTHFPNGLDEIDVGQTQQPFNIIYDSLSTPHMLQWNLNVQQQLDSATVLTVGYNGSRGLNLISVGNYNAPDAVFLEGVLTIPQGATRRNPRFDFFSTTATIADSWYNALVAGLVRRMEAGLQFQLSYTWAKSLSTADQTRFSLAGSRTDIFPIDLAHMDADKGRTPWDLRQAFTLNAVYELPFGSGKPWLSDGPVAAVLGGWQVGGILTLKTGTPFTYITTTPSALTALTIQVTRPLAKPGQPVGGSILGTPAESCDSQPCLRYYDPNNFAPPGTRQLGNVGRNTGTAPGIASLDFSLQKRFSFTERMGLQFRAEAFNLLNRVNFGLPNRNVFGSNGLPQGSTGVISDTTVNSRELQFGLKLTF
ncbi:MAG: TonB-dependent receptor [Acidobacteria bacterium]|nr:TonB-dependent receptor [Acidobacteriota bacterium]